MFRLRQQEQQQRAGHRHDATQLDRAAQPRRSRNEGDGLQPDNPPDSRDHGDRRFGGGPGAGWEQFARPRSEHGSAGARERTPQYVADKKADRTGREAEARRGCSGHRERDGRPAPSESIGQVTTREVGNRRGDATDHYQDAYGDGRPVQNEAGVDGVEQPRRIQQDRKEPGHRREDQHAATPWTLHEKPERRTGHLHSLPGLALGKQPPDKRRDQDANSTGVEEPAPVRSYQGVGDHNDEDPDPGEQREHDHGRAAVLGGRLLDDQGGDDPRHQHLEADREQLEEREDRDRGRKTARQVGQRGTSHANCDQSLASEFIRERGQRERAESPDRQH